MDPTFSLGQFNVFLGPVHITGRPLELIASSLVGIRAFGTDGEKAISDTFSHEFKFSHRLTRFILYMSEEI